MLLNSSQVMEHDLAPIKISDWAAGVTGRAQHMGSGSSGERHGAGFRMGLSEGSSSRVDEALSAQARAGLGQRMPHNTSKGLTIPRFQAGSPIGCEVIAPLAMAAIAPRHVGAELVAHGPGVL